MLILKILFILLLVGFFVEHILTILDNKRYPSPGKLVDIGGYKLHIYDTGTGSGPTVVLDMGLGGNMLYWSYVQSEVAKFARVVSYDRAGLGWSDKSPFQRTSSNIALELHNMLHKANIPGPYILVGHSFAGITARIYANKYPKEVVGVILVDSSNENQIDILPKPQNLLSKLIDYPFSHPFITIFSKLGLLRLFHLYNDNSDKFDKKLRKIMRAKNSTGKFISTYLEECRLFEQNMKEVQANKYLLKNLPLIVVTAGVLPSKETCAAHGHAFPEICNKAYAIWQSLQKDLLTKSTCSKQIMAYKSGHIIPEDEPEAVVEAVRDMIQLTDNTAG